MSGPRYAELQVTSHFSFLRGASSAEELFAAAALLGVEAIGVVDRNSLAGIVRAWEAAKTTGVRLVVGCRLDLACGLSVLVYPTDRPAYSRLCRLLTLGKGRAGKGECRLLWADLVAYGEGLLAVLIPDRADEACGYRLRRLRDAFGDRAYLALTLCRRPNDQLRLHELSNLATAMRVPTLVTNDVLFHAPDRRMLQDVVTAIRHNTTIDALGFRRERHADRYLKPPAEMHRLANAHGAAIVAAREDRSFVSVDDLWRRVGVPAAALERIAEADGFRPAFGLARREALWAIKGLRDEGLPLFTAASERAAETVPEVSEPAVTLRPMTAGGEVVEDYGHLGLSLRAHPLAFLRSDLRGRRIVTCAEAMAAHDGRWMEAAGIVLVRQRPGSAKGVVFITLEDETGIANLVVWTKVFERHRRIVLSAGMIAVTGRVQREGEVVHLVAHRITDLSRELAGIGNRDGPFPLPYGPGDAFHHGSPPPDPRELPTNGPRPRDIFIPDLHIDAIRVKTRDFR